VTTADPVSWLVVEPGWRVLDREGKEIGKVEEVLGDRELDIFDGLRVRRRGLLGGGEYVSADAVREIREGEIHLDT
jgi:hypothetical protein